MHENQISCHNHFFFNYDIKNLIMMQKTRGFWPSLTKRMDIGQGHGIFLARS